MLEIDKCVVEYQKTGEDATFVTLYKLLQPTKEMAMRRLRKSLPSTVDEAGILEIYDDAVVHCVDNYSAEKGCSFITFLSREIEDNRKMRIRKDNAEKRKSDSEAIALDATVADDSETRIADLLVDGSAIDPLENLQCADIVDSLKAFMSTSQKNHLAGLIIAYDVSSFENREEKHAALCKLLGQEMTTSGIHKKIKRAKAAFRAYLENK